jgi:hypothetical protein
LTWNGGKKLTFEPVEPGFFEGVVVVWWEKGFVRGIPVTNGSSGEGNRKERKDENK